MASTIRELRAKFSATAEGFRSTIRTVRQELNGFGSDSQRSVDRANDEFRGLQRTLDHVEEDLNDLGSETELNEFNRELNRTEGNLDDLGQTAATEANRVGGSFDGLRKKLRGLVGIIAGVFAIDKIKDFGTSLVESSAEAEAMNAQFEQVFGDIQDNAQETIDSLGKDFGMMPNRIKPALTTMTSMFQGLGMDTEDAMNKASDAVTLVADAAAFYDKSFEDANSALNSFIKGNYEGGESIGLFANETQLAAWASKELGIDWKNLDEAGKQVARLEFAQAMQEAAGATGQASRESDSYQNQLGNLKQTWQDLKARFGEPILKPVISGLQKLSKWLGKIDVEKIQDGFKTVGGYLSDVFKPVIDDIGDGIQILYDKFKDSGGVDAAKKLFEGFKDILQWIKDNTEVVTATLGGLAGAFIAFKVLTGINKAIGVFNTLMFAVRTGTLSATLAQWGLNTAMLASPFTWIAVGIGALIAIIILLWKNWDSVSKWLGASWDWIKNKAAQIFGGIGDFVSGLKDKVVNKFTELKDGVVNKVTELKLRAEAKFNEIKNRIAYIVTAGKELVVNKFNDLKNGAIDKVTSLYTKAKEKFNKIKEAITDPIEKAKKKVTGWIDDIKSAFSNIKTKIKLPHFSIKNASLNPKDWITNGIPKLAVDWYAKGAVFTEPTIFDTPNGLKGFGEAGAEAALPLTDKVLGTIGAMIAKLMPINNPEVINLLRQIERGISSGMNATIIMDEKVVGQVVEPHVTEKQKFNESRERNFGGKTG